ncbi:hypothetical protein SAMN05444359_1387 [Neolewinella agarilytica]|uniref:Uncharacterized protein n=1 Tax=Neolewinella agarilytica TaxID=478744 RepID=A0A1H9NLS8_9BACT|nr:hypothetical protein SAMN05444359_1387 [Neolewinella agarilytica]
MPQNVAGQEGVKAAASDESERKPILFKKDRLGQSFRDSYAGQYTAGREFTERPAF